MCMCIYTVYIHIYIYTLSIYIQFSLENIKENFKSLKNMLTHLNARLMDGWAGGLID